MKRVVKILGKSLVFLLVTIIMVSLTLLGTIYLFCKGPSNQAQSLFVTTFLETGQMKGIVGLFLSKDEINKAITSNSLKTMDEEMNLDLISVNKDLDQEAIKVEKISGSTYFATMLMIKDPSTVSVATTYPWGTYGKELHEIVKNAGAVAGVNGGLYESSGNTGGRPLGVVVSNGEIQSNNPNISGTVLIGIDNNNLLRIIPLKGMNTNDVKALITKEQIRDGVTFQDETSDKNNHFVQLIINKERRELNGLGSGANPRTAIGQREDGTILLLVTDGRGANGHLGATASDLIDIMERYGAVNAANLDGGSSSCMYYDNAYLMTSVTFYYSNSSWRIPTAFVVKEAQ